MGETSLVVGDGDLVLLAGGLLDGGHVEDAVGVDVEGDLDLGLATRHGGDAVEVELAEEVVVRVMERSPSKTWMSTPGWLSA